MQEHARPTCGPDFAFSSVRTSFCWRLCTLVAWHRIAVAGAHDVGVAVCGLQAVCAVGMEAWQRTRPTLKVPSRTYMVCRALELLCCEAVQQNQMSD